MPKIYLPNKSSKFNVNKLTNLLTRQSKLTYYLCNQTLQSDFEMSKAIKSKSQIERELLHYLAIACYRAPSGPLMKCPNVISRINAIETHITKALHSDKFDNEFCQRTGNLNADFSMHVNCHGKVNVYRKTHPVNQTQEKPQCLLA